MSNFGKTLAVTAAVTLLGAGLAVGTPAEAQERRGFLAGLFPGEGFVDKEAARERQRAIGRRGPSNRPIYPETGTLSYGGKQPLLVRKEFPDGGSTIIFF